MVQLSVQLKKPQPKIREKRQTLFQRRMNVFVLIGVFKCQSPTVSIPILTTKNTHLKMISAKRNKNGSREYHKCYIRGQQTNKKQ